MLLVGEGYGGAMHWERLCAIAKKVGFCAPVLYESEDLEHHDDAILERIPGNYIFDETSKRRS